MMVKINGYCNSRAISCDIVSVTAYSRKIFVFKKNMMRMSFYTDDKTYTYIVKYSG